jgi:site-specific DNA-methyltransferase (adenine-specific)
MGVGLTDSPVYGSARPDFSSVRGHDDEGGASRFFYVPKASRDEREMGLERLKPLKTAWNENFGAFQHDPHRRPIRNQHPTVKPIDLMRYLIRLVTPRGGLVLDPFLGSGTTLIACRLEGMAGVGVEKNSEYEPIIKGRINVLPPAIEGFDSEAFSAPQPSSASAVQVLQSEHEMAYCEPPVPRKIAKQITLEGF